MPTIVFETKDRDGNDISAVSVTMDGQPLAGRLEGTALSIDPGEHAFVFTTHDAPPVEKRLIIRESEKGRREKIVLGGNSAAGPVPQAPPAGPDAPPAAPFASTEATPVPPPAASSAGSGGTQRVIGIVVGGVGVVGLGVALFEQITAKNRYAASKRAANSLDPVVGSATHRHYEEAKDAQTLAIIFGAVGAVALGTGLVLVLTSFGGSEHAPDAHASATPRWQLAPAVGPGSAALTLSSQF
jgi:serine/threonine-protein kinase